MKKIYILVLSIISVNVANSQITLTSTNNNPSIGDSFTIHSFDGATINSGASGANVTWDYSTIISSSNTVSTYVLPSSLSQNASYPLSNMASGTPNSEGYYLIDSDEYSIAGAYISGQVQDVYSDVREFYKFPITFGDVFNETFSGNTTNLSTSQTFGRGGSIQIEADAYGTLILPYGTVNNVLRVKTTTNYTDTFMAAPIMSYNDVHYFWFNANTKNPILAYDEFTSIAGTIFLAQYIDVSDVVSGLGDDFTQKSPILIYPNPATSFVNISLDKTYSNATLKIVDVTGKMVKMRAIENSVNKISFQLDDLEKGIYFIQILEKDNVISTEKLIVK